MSVDLNSEAMPVSDSPSGPQKLTRAELYEKAWSEPMATLGPKLGLSDTGLRKICDKYHIPTPPRGYWAKVAVGQRIKRPPLPKLPAAMRGSEETVIVFHQPPRPAPPELGAQRAEDDSPAGVRRRFEAAPENHIVVLRISPKSITRFGPKRSPVSVHGDQPFRRMSITGDRTRTRG
ncbi:MAG: hypothetical protein ACK5N1_03275 [Gemmatimonas sp.]